jgi:hypothetical protein
MTATRPAEQSLSRSWGTPPSLGKARSPARADRSGPAPLRDLCRSVHRDDHLRSAMAPAGGQACQAELSAITAARQTGRSPKVNANRRSVRLSSARFSPSAATHNG